MEGWHPDGYPANLHPIPPVVAGRRYVELAGGPDALLDKAAKSAGLDDFGPTGLPIQGVFTGPDPVRDKVLKTGDRYEGVPVTSVASIVSNG